MILIILLLISIIIQTVATVVALSMMRATKYNASWILFIVALTIISIQRIEEFVAALNHKFALGWNIEFTHHIGGWGGVISSLCLAIAVMLVKKILSYIALREKERQQSDERILKAVIKAEEHQKQRLAKELHDGLGPLLSTAHMSISALEPHNSSQQLIVANAENAINVAIKTLREVSNNLSPHILENFGLARAVSVLVKSFNNTQQIKVSFEHNIPGRRFSTEIEMALYRVISELLNNTAKHSAARNVDIKLNYQNDIIKLQYNDNGRGFDTATLHSGMGLSNIRSRVSSANGDFMIHSEPQKGMSAVIIFTDV